MSKSGSSAPHRRLAAKAALAASLASLLAVGAVRPLHAADALPGDGRTVKPARASWDTFWFGGIIVATGLERLGYKVATAPSLGSAALYQALGQGDVDFTVDTVMPQSATYVEKYKDAITNVPGPVMAPGSIQGYLVDKATAAKYDIKYMDDLRDPAKAKPFLDDTGRIPVIGPNVGWGSEKLVVEDLKRLKLDRTVKLVQGEYSILAADTVSRYRAGKPVVLWGWYPNTATIQIAPGSDLVWLVFKDGESADTGPLPTDVPGCAVAGPTCNTGSSPTQYYISVNNKWAAQNPAAVKFFSLVRMKLQDRVDQNAKMMNGQKSEADLRAQAADWIARNRKDFDRWVDEARAAK